MTVEALLKNMSLSPASVCKNLFMKDKKGALYLLTAIHVRCYLCEKQVENDVDGIRTTMERFLRQCTYRMQLGDISSLKCDEHF